MPLFRSRDDKLLRALQTGMRLLLPADPGPEQMLDAVRQFNPDARPDGARIYVDGSRLYLGQAFQVDPETAQQAGLPADVTRAYFLNWLQRGPQFAAEVFTQKYQERKRFTNADFRAQGSYALGGLAARFGGLSAPRPKELDEPLHASVYIPRRLGGDDLADLLARRAPGLRPVEGQTRPNVNGCYTGDGPFEVESWSPGGTALHLADELLKGSMALARDDGIDWIQGVLVLRAAQPPAQADPETARALGEAALGLAADTGGTGLDVFGFRVRRPEDLIVR